MDFLTLFTSVAVSSSLSAFGVWLAKSWISERLKGAIQSEYDQKLEAYKIKLQAESSIALARLNADLQITAARRNIEHSRIHEKRLDFISELVGKIDNFHQAIASYVSLFEWTDGPSKADRRKALAQQFEDLSKFYRPRRLFLTPEIVEKMDSFLKGSHDVSMDFMLNVEQGRENEVTTDKHTDTWIKASDYANKEAPTIIATLNQEFRLLLGIVTIAG